MKETEIETTTTYPEPAPELIDDIRKRLAELPREVADYINDALKREAIQHVSNYLWKTGHFVFMLSELYEYRRTLFPPNAMVEPYTAGPPVLRDRSADSLSAPAPATGNGSLTHNRRLITDNEPLTTDDGPPPSGTPTTGDGPPAPDTLTTADGPPTSDIRPPTSGAVLLNDLRDVIKRYVVLPEMAAEALALWVVHTYAFTLRQVTTYIGVVSPEKRCGKTTLLELLGLLANRSLTASNISPSAMFRVIEGTQPTLLIDEADTFLQGRDELAGILNAGYRKGNSYVVRVAERKRVGPVPSPGAAEPEFGEWNPDSGLPTSDLRSPSSIPCNVVTDHHVTNHGLTGLARYSCWCPKVMAAIGRLPDTLADRCIVITMQRKMSGEKCERMRQLNAAEYRKRSADFVRENREAIAQARPETPSGLNDRAADIWEPLLAIADLAGGDWPELARQAAQQLSASDDEMTLVGYFLKDLRNYMVLSDVDRMLCRDIVKRLNPMHDRPWEDLRRGREINEWWLGRLLGELGLRSRTTRVGDATGKGYTLADIDAAFRRYVPKPDLHTAISSSFSSSSSSSTSGSAPSETSDPETDAQIERDLLKLMQQLMTQPKP